jgi:uncharacterized protein YcnI
MGYAQRAAGLAILSAVAVSGIATPAAADVSFDSQQGQRTGGARVALKVTNEHPTASITKVELRFPGDLQLPEVYPIAVADWAPAMTMTKVDDNPANDVTGSVVWITMPGKEVKPGAASVLPVAMGPMPDREAVYLDVIQTRSDGSIETWAGVDVPAAGAQHPALKLELTPLAPGQVVENHNGGAATAAAHTDVAADPVAEEPESTEGAGPIRLAVVLLLIAGLTVFALYWQRRRGAARSDAKPAADASPAARAFAPRKKGVPAKRPATPAPAKAGSVKAAAAKTAQKKAAPAKASTPAAEPVQVPRRSVVRSAPAKRAAGRRAVARKAGGGAATVTIARQRGNAQKRSSDSEGDNA